MINKDNITILKMALGNFDSLWFNFDQGKVIYENYVAGIYFEAWAGRIFYVRHNSSFAYLTVNGQIICVTEFKSQFQNSTSFINLFKMKSALQKAIDSIEGEVINW